jgi:acyl-CoA dehydrogenase
MSDAQKLIVDTATRLFEDKCKPETLRQAARGEWSGDLWQQVEETGLPLASIPESAGGVGGSLSDALAVLRIAGQYAAPLPLAESYLAGWLLSGCGLPVSGEPLTVAFSEKGAIRINPQNDQWYISGTVPQVPYARNTSKIVVLGQNEGKEQLYLAIVPAEQIQLEQNQNLANEPRDTLTFNNLAVSQAYPLEYDLNWVKSRATLARSALIVGALEAIMKRTVNHAAEREQFGRTLNQFQAIQQQLALMAVEVTSARISLEAAAHDIENNENAGEGLVSIALARVRVVEAANQVVPMAHQIHGAMGYTYEYPLHYLTKRVWAWREEYGSETEWAKWLGQYVAAKGGDNLWSAIIAR